MYLMPQLKYILHTSPKTVKRKLEILLVTSHTVNSTTQACVKYTVRMASYVGGRHEQTNEFGISATF